ncbi:cytochrome c oxidase assembly protein COX16-domain-containing protein [Mycena rebaudengoi]|nr:cytochrome c oxidase assembly protein COX16-domain-containing protein [Mycena rebaudengoi]
MPVFSSRPLNPPRVQRLLNKQPLLFGVPFVLLMVGASYGLTAFTQTKYELRDQRVKQVTKEEELKLQRDRKKFDIREEYFRLSAKPEEDWDMKRVPRPKGTPEWGVPPPEPPSSSNVKE